MTPEATIHGQQHLLSVVVPTFNEGEGVVSCLARLQKCEGIGEVILVDASDEPKSLAILSSLNVGSDVLVENAPQKGRAQQMNFGASKASCQTLLFLHCDSEISLDAAAKIETCLQSRRWGRFDVMLDATGWQFRLIETMMKLRSRLTNLATGDQGIFVQSDWFAAQGGFADIPLMEDIEFSRRVSSSFKPGLIKSALKTSARRWQQLGVWKTIALMWKLRLLYRWGTPPEKLAAMYINAR